MIEREESENKWDKLIKLKSLEDKRRKEEFLLIEEKELPHIFRNPVLVKQKMI